MFNMKHICFSIILVLFCLAGIAQAPKYSNEFLNLGVSARAFAMGNAQVAIVDDITSGYWNPAGLRLMKPKAQFSFMHSEYFGGISKYDYAGVGYNINSNSAAGITFIRFGTDNIPNTTELIDNQGNFDYSKITPFSAADVAILLSYAHSFNHIKDFSIGGNVKIIRRTIGKFAGCWGFGLDFGAQYMIKKWRMGLMLRDVTSTFNAWNFNLSDRMKEVFLETGNSLPENGLELTLPKAIMGVGRNCEFGKGFNGTFTLDLAFTFDGRRNSLVSSKALNIDPQFGLELAFKRIVALRAGLGNFQRETDFLGKKRFSCQINFGVGVGIKDIVTIDYAFTDIGNLSIAVYSHVFSLKIAIDRFKKTVETPN